MQIISAPTSTGSGRRRIAGTILRRGATRVAVVRRVYSLGENAGNTGSPRVECWVGLCDPDMRPIIVRRGGESWAEADRLDIGPIWMPAVVTALALCGYQQTDVWPGNPSPAWPTSIWDRRIILPDDARFPTAKRRTIGKSILDLLTTRNECSDDFVWSVDAQIIGIAPKAAQR